MRRADAKRNADHRIPNKARDGGDRGEHGRIGEKLPGRRWLDGDRAPLGLRTCDQPESSSQNMHIVPALPCTESIPLHPQAAHCRIKPARRRKVQMPDHAADALAPPATRRRIADGRLWIMAAYGFVAGLPLPLSGFTFRLWMSESNVSLAAIGLTANIGL